MVAPSTLTAAGVPVSALTQEAGTFVITFPNAYHAAVDLGNNCSEEVSVAPADWLRFGALSTSRYRNFRRPCAFSQEEMITRAAELATAPKPAVQAVNAAPAADAVANGVGEAMDAEGAGAETPGATPDRPSARTCSYVSKELARVLEEERVMRCKLWTDGLVRSRQVMPGEGMDPEAGGTAECTICHLPLHLSAVECDCCPRRRTCLHHAANLCECPMRRRRLAWRYTLQQLERLQVETQAAVPPAVAAAIESEEVQLQAAVQGALEAAKAVQAAKPVVVAEVKEEEPATANGAETSAATEAPAVKAEEAAGALEELAGLITGLADDGPGPSAAPSGASTGTQLGKRKRDSEMAVSKPTGPLPLTALSPNGYVQGPVRPFAVLDVYPEDQEAVADWLQAISKACAAWCSKATSVLECGGPMADDLPNLVEQAEQFLWGGAGSEAANEVRQLQPRLAAAEDYMAAVHAALKGKPTIEAVQALLQQEPKPLGDPPGLEALREAIVLAQEWRQRCAVLAAPDAPLVDARLLEAAVNEASRLPISLPEAKVLRERLATARKVAEAIRTALPTAREAGRRRKDEGAITVEYLQHLRNQAISARVEMPEVANLTSSLDRLEAWQQNAAEASRVRCQLSELKELLEEAESLPAVLPEIEHIRSLAEKGDVWLRQMQHALATKAPLKKVSRRCLSSFGYAHWVASYFTSSRL